MNNLKKFSKRFHDLLSEKNTFNSGRITYLNPPITGLSCYGEVGRSIFELSSDGDGYKKGFCHDPTLSGTPVIQRANFIKLW